MSDAVRRYHEATMHTPERLRKSAYTLDWDNQPDPFRHYEGAPLVDLPADVPLAPPANGAELLSALLFHSAAVSSSKLSPAGTRYALRVNPSSGNLHPVEFHFSTRGLAHWPDGLYHYRPSQHMAEQRASGAFDEPALTFLLTVIAWREAWKYRSRAYRYCLLDAGHAIEALVTAARALHLDYTLETSFDDDDIHARYQLAADEWPLAFVHFDAPHSTGAPAPLRWTPGTPNRLSGEILPYPSIDAIHAATRRQPTATPDCTPRPGDIQLPEPAPILVTAETIRQRRSALDFVGGHRTITLDQLSALLAHATSANLYIHLWLYVHRVDGLAPGLYRYDHWTHTLELRRAGDQRVIAAALSLQQDLAGNSAVSFSLTAPLDYGYRDIHLEAGRLGHRLYLGAEALGLRATGMGAFFDLEAAAYLALENEAVLYHFALGYAVPDPRIEAG